jgi:hypothetical protein
MFAKFLALEWKAFFRSAAFRANLVIKILMGFAALYFTGVFLAMGIGIFFLLRKNNIEPLAGVNRFLVYYVVFDLVVRLLLQKIPVMNIRPLLVMNLRRRTIVNYAVWKMFLSFFNFLSLFLLIPFAIVLMVHGYDVIHVILWYAGMKCLIYANNFWNILLNDKDFLYLIFLGLLVGVGLLQYYGYFDVTAYTAPLFDALYGTYWAWLLPLALFLGLYWFTFSYLKNGLYLDTGLSQKHQVAQTEDFTWLDQFGTVGTFLKNDIRLIKRNKRSKSTVVMSFIFLFYGLLFFTHSIEAYDNPFMHMFAGIFVTGGFLFTFGQFVPSWDSSYYNLMMTQNISYKGYLMAKWWLVVIAVFVSALLASFYIYFGWMTYLTILVGAVYNMGVNSHLVLLGGAWTKTPIDLSAARAAFGDRKAFNVKTMLISLPKLLLPMLLYGLGSVMISKTAGILFVLAAGIIGFLLRDKVFAMIGRIYKNEKYDTIAAYRQNND